MCSVWISCLAMVLCPDAGHISRGSFWAAQCTTKKKAILDTLSFSCPNVWEGKFRFLSRYPHFLCQYWDTSSQGKEFCALLAFQSIDRNLLKHLRGAWGTSTQGTSFPSPLPGGGVFLWSFSSVPVLEGKEIAVSFEILFFDRLLSKRVFFLTSATSALGGGGPSHEVQPQI